MTMDPGRRLRLQAFLSLALLAVGLALALLMVTTEGEPGALPLALVVGGAAWRGWIWQAQRRHRNQTAA